MRKLGYTLIALFITLGSFAQDKTALTTSLEKLMKAKNGDVIFTGILEKTISNIEASKQAAFKTEIEALATKIQAEAIAEFTKRYSTAAEVDAMYTEFMEPGRIDKSDKVNGFSRAWRNHKGRFQQGFKKIYRAYQL